MECDQGGQSSGDPVQSSFGDPNSHFTDLLGGHVEAGVWRRHPEALQAFGTTSINNGVGVLVLLLCQAAGIHLGLADDLGMSPGFSHLNCV